MFKSINLSFLHFRVDFICFLSFARHKGREGGEIPHTELGKNKTKINPETSGHVVVEDQQ